MAPNLLYNFVWTGESARGAITGRHRWRSSDLVGGGRRPGGHHLRLGLGPTLMILLVVDLALVFRAGVVESPEPETARTFLALAAVGFMKLDPTAVL